MKYCKKCLYPDTKPQLEFNSDGICSACTNVKMKEEIDWDKKRKEFAQILEKYTDKDGIERWTTDVVVSGFNGTLQMLDRRDDSSSSPPSEDVIAKDQVEPSITPVSKDEFEDDIPF